MRAIAKGPEPARLTAHRQTPHSNYDNYPAKDKDDLRDALVAEQRGLCCYCMCRIRPDRKEMKIEHWKCLSHEDSDDRDGLVYRNLLGACPGGHGQPGDKQHCDTKKGDKDLKWNPAHPAHLIEKRVRYELDGSIQADDEEFDEQLNDVLNLNLDWLKNNRKQLLNAVLEWWKRERARIGGPVSRDRVIRKREEQLGPHEILSPYCQVAVWWLDEKLARMKR